MVRRKDLFILLCVWLHHVYEIYREFLSVDHVVPTAPFLHFILLNAPVQVNVVWNCVWIAVVSELWKYRNKHIFQGGEIDHSEVFTLAQLKDWSWITSKTVSATFTYTEWCIDPKTCMFPIK